MHRRTFLQASCAGLAALALSARRVLAADAEIVVTARQGPVINPHLYGHFIEHLGGVIYDGVWVGRQSESRERRRAPQGVRR